MRLVGHSRYFLASLLVCKAHFLRIANIGADRSESPESALCAAFQKQPLAAGNDLPSVCFVVGRSGALLVTPTPVLMFAVFGAPARDRPF